MTMEDRTDIGEGDCYIVTGSIGPQFEPKLFRKKNAANAYAREVVAYGKLHNICPPFKPVIENRWRSDMFRMEIVES